MKRLFAVLLCIYMFISATTSVSAVSSVPDPVINATESVVRILAEYPDGYATGSGFVIKSDNEETLIATNYHVVEGKPYSISVWLGEEETVSATIFAFTTQKDICILKLAYPVSLKPLFFSEKGAKQGEAVYAVGFPGAADYLSDKEAHTSADATITDGIVSAVREATVSSYGTPAKILQINAAINSGNSGGPLFNTSGEVVGINTYGINDSQGIFGAIDVSELKAFIVDHSIPIPSAENGFPWWVIVVTVVAIMGAALTLVIVMKKKKIKTSRPVEAKQVSLSEYMTTNPGGIGIHNAVAMLLPVALQLRDMHNNGCAHLEVSPISISVGENGAVLCEATSSEANRYSSGFAAPEIYKGTHAGNLSDIYSFCAALSFVVSGKQPTNSLSRTNDEDGLVAVDETDNSFADILKMGMSLDVTTRIATMQEVIVKLSAYNIQPFVKTTAPTEQSTSIEPPKRKRRNSVKKVVAVAIVALVVLLLGTYFGCYMGAKNNAQTGDFTAADNMLLMPQITKLHDPNLVEYINAGKKLDSRQYSESKKVFQSLSGYLNADELALEADYRYAIQCADANDFATAISMMSVLSDAQYSDSADKLLEFQYRHGVFLLLEKSNFSEANKIFAQLVKKDYSGAEDMQKETQYLWAISLIEAEDYIGAHKKLAKIKSYSDVKDTLEVLEGLMYTEGQELYRSGIYAQAETYFERISSYGDSKKYLALIEVHTYLASPIGDFFPYREAKNTVNEMVEFFYFEDTAELLLSSLQLGKHFLLGTWRGDGYYFTMKGDGSISYDLPRINYGDYYRIKDGKILLYPENEKNNTKTLFEFAAISPDCIMVFCYKNNQTYTLYRQ